MKQFSIIIFDSRNFSRRICSSFGLYVLQSSFAFATNTASHWASMGNIIVSSPFVISTAYRKKLYVEYLN